MSFESEIIEKIKNSSNWPTFEKPDYLGMLNQLADDALKSSEKFAPISAILIYQQLVEELLRLILSFSGFLIQARMWPWKVESKELKGAMFGRVFDELKKTVEFQHRDQILIIANEINEIRIQVAHGLAKFESIEPLRAKAIEVENKFNELFRLYEETDEWFRLCLKNIKQTVA